MDIEKKRRLKKGLANNLLGQANICDIIKCEHIWQNFMGVESSGPDIVATTNQRRERPLGTYAITRGNNNDISLELIIHNWKKK